MLTPSKLVRTIAPRREIDLARSKECCDRNAQRFRPGGREMGSVGFGSGSSFKVQTDRSNEVESCWASLSYLSLTASVQFRILLHEPNGAPTMAAATGFLTALSVGDLASPITLPRRAALIPGRWAAAGALRVAAEAGTDEAEKKKKQRGITKPRPVSPQLQAVVGEV
ncbi:hypothetical protein ZIOFF_069528 [Zingiber officinale]|uniref:Uncharacterized protein n=1 Tax=Zingiber officinale TaxID=94328 RepID=A0A8J5ERS8_ZINOF|nr:hypothetical protein ZIOFF_069528 [Zingiber officinale]